MTDFERGLPGEMGNAAMPYAVMISKYEVKRLLEAFGWGVVLNAPHTTSKGKQITMMKYKDPTTGEVLVPSDALVRQMERLIDGRKA